MKPLDLSIAILAGGASQRFGTDKTLAKFRGMPLIKHMLWRFNQCTDDLFVVSRFDAPDRLQLIDVPIVYDSHPSRSVMGAVLDALVTSRHAWTFVLAVDFPLITFDLIESMIKAVNLGQNEASVILPFTQQGIQPLSAFYHKSAQSLLSSELAMGRQKMTDLINQPACRSFKVDDHAQWRFLNMNTPADMQSAEQLADLHALKFSPDEGALVPSDRKPEEDR